MEVKGKLKGIDRDWDSLKFNITFEIDEANMNELESLQERDLSINIKKYRKKRSLDANGMLWICLQKIANAINSDKWSVYLEMLKRYGKGTYICVRQEAVERVKETWRTCEIIGEIDVNGQKAIQMMCYFGSSTYDTEEFNYLLNGVISEMKEMGLERPLSSEIRRVIEEYEKYNAE